MLTKTKIYHNQATTIATSNSKTKFIALWRLNSLVSLEEDQGPLEEAAVAPENMTKASFGSECDIWGGDDFPHTRVACALFALHQTTTKRGALDSYALQADPMVELSAFPKLANPL